MWLILCLGLPASITTPPRPANLASGPLTLSWATLRWGGGEGGVARPAPEGGEGGSRRGGHYSIMIGYQSMTHSMTPVNVIQ